MSKKRKKDKNFVKMPQYPGGNSAMREFINSQLRYPEEALKNRVEGQVHIAYSVSNEGKVEDVEVLNGIGYGCDEEAVRVISLLKYAPAANHQFKVRSSQRTRIHFRLPGTAPNTASTIQYTVVPEKEKPAQEKAGQHIYSYTITLGN